jgi:nucleoside-diphosphate-sugar epimerase
VASPSGFSITSPPAMQENLAAVRRQIDFHRADIRDLESIRPHFAGVDYVIHLAALASVARSMEDPGRDHAGESQWHAARFARGS